MMKRKCPKCKKKGLYISKLALMLRPRCICCGETIGFHWGFAGVYACFETLVIGLLAIHLMSFLSITMSLLVLTTVFVPLSLISAYLGPLEVKYKWWQS
ncbi:hypothetical protein [Aliikangiella sp. G2MR2-5]|uniref:hypothetical protein n=1 Tax=Aliikangiella sp. G2MR2-5 TaxID=2788943 RepID=UPI0018A91154|nr:hypothetical protein [Aliikangiella sp. G2MR2-5]